MSARAYYAERDSSDRARVGVIEEDEKRHPLYVQAVVADFEWGYEGAGPTELARAILIDAIGEEFASPVYRDFARLFIARQPVHGFLIPEPVVYAWAFLAHTETQRHQLVQSRGSRRLRVIPGQDITVSHPKPEKVVTGLAERIRREGRFRGAF